MRIHGGRGEEGVDFSVNLNPLGPPEGSYEVVERCIKSGVLERYPDYNYEKLKRAISSFYGCREEDIVPTSGAGEAINLAIFALKPKWIYVLEPSYGEYEVLSKALGISYKPVFYRKSGDVFSLNFSDLEEACGREDSLIVITNPSNPLGIYIERGEIIEKLSRCRARVLMDEAYSELCSRCAIELGSGIPENFLLVRSMTKWLSLPGIRLGFLFSSSREVLEKIDAVRQPWNVGSLADCFARELLSRKDEAREFIMRSRRYIEGERKRMLNELKSLGLKPYDSSANFILVESPRGLDLSFLLKGEGIHVRSCASFKGLGSSFIRIGIRKPHEDDELINALKRVIENE
ncbi:histidinol-phosphate aminotransferase family protein [Fervidicoccus fontis]|uniref:Aminotransferase n=1 Tax=Fervidicoccus fontis TaxID=683846 RepID=A0A843ACE7_9CREN|nr:histidinol-phosphate transaminase [Fervidicoccus fontis]MBE9390767.1 histidinol-phosphate aminotransferase family protein [Fervidicoccus fontis]